MMNHFIKLLCDETLSSSDTDIEDKQDITEEDDYSLIKVKIQQYMDQTQMNMILNPKKKQTLNTSYLFQKKS